MKIKSLKQRNKRLSEVEKLLVAREVELIEQGHVSPIPEDIETRMCEGITLKFLLYQNDGIDNKILVKGQRMLKLMADEVYSNLAKERMDLRNYKPPRTFEEDYNAGAGHWVKSSKRKYK